MNGSPDLPRPRFARAYLRGAPRADARGAAAHRDELLAGCAGRVVEIGAGSGLNFQRYPPTVAEVLAVEPEPTLRAAALRAAEAASVAVSVRAGTADELPLADAWADAAVASLVLCSVPDPARALGELFRVLRPGGELRFYEHVVARRHPKRALLQLADRTRLWPAVAGGCHAARDTAAAITAAGFDIERCRSFGFRATALQPSVPHILGLARRPA